MKPKTLLPRLNHSLLQSLTTVLFLLQIGCGATQLGMCAPHTREEGRPVGTWTECFEQPISYARVTHSVFCLNTGTSKPPVLLLHELTGLSPGTLAYAEELSKDFTVYVPLLFGEKGKFSLMNGLSAYWFRGLVEFFPGGEWGTPSNGSAPIVNWLRGVVQHIGDRHSAQPIGLIGNCVTGPIPLALLNHPHVSAAVIAQPALPMRFWWYSDADKASLGLSTDDLQFADHSRAKIYGLRFETDCMSDQAKLHTLHDRFGVRFLNGEIPANHYQRDGKPMKAHSTLIGSWRKDDEAGRPSRDARAQVRAFLLAQLSESRHTP